jgi:hypothetical protein
MSKFTDIKELYPNEYENFYPNQTVNTPLEDSEPDESINDTPVGPVGPSKKVRFAEPLVQTPPPLPTQTPIAPQNLKSRITSIVKANLINIVIILIGFILVSNDSVLNYIESNITQTSVAGMALRGLGLILFYISIKVVTTLFLKLP